MLCRVGSWLYRISDRLLMALFVGGVQATPFFQADSLRARLLAGTDTPATAGVAALCLGLCLAWRSLLRRDFVWLAPARLTWADATDQRIGRIGRRLWGGWLVRLLAVAYVTALAILLLGGKPWLPAGYAVFGGVSLCAVVLAPRRPGPVTAWPGNLVVLGLAALAGWSAVHPVGSNWLWVVAGVAVALAVGSGPPRRPAVVTPDRNLVPVGLIVQLVRGPDVLVIGLLVAGAGLPIATAALVVAVLAGFGVLR
jgi:hypothetical protein